MKYIMALTALVFFASCSTKKQVVYFQDIDDQTLEKIDSLTQIPVIQVNDMLGIDVSASDPSSESVAPFKLKRDETSTQTGFIVDTEGHIHFPVIGSIEVAGKTINEIQEQLQDSIALYVVDPIVVVRLMNFKITVLGAVSNPGTFTLEDPTYNMLQAIGAAGDFDINGRRDNVLLIRQVNGVRQTTRIDFTSSNWLNETSYIVKQNDIIYVEPNYAEVKSAGLISDLTELLRIVTVVTTTYILLSR